MFFHFRLRALLGACLLLAAGSCQRAGYYSFQPAAATLAGPARVLPAAPCPDSGQVARAAWPARMAGRVVLRRLRRQLGQRLRSAPLVPAARTLAQRPTASRPRAVPPPHARQRPAMNSEDVKFFAILIGSGPLLLAGGLLLILAVGGWLATIGGVLLLLLAAAAGLFTLYVYLLGKSSQR